MAAEALNARDFAGPPQCLLAGALAAAYVGVASCERWRPHALSLDWGLEGGDSLRDHPVERCRRGEVAGCVEIKFRAPHAIDAMLSP